MAKAVKLITVDQSLILGLRNTVVESISLCAAAANSTLEIFDGAIGTIATKAIAAGGTLYTVGDTITLVQAGGGVQAVFTVATVDAPETGVVTGLTLVSGGTGYVAGTTYATTGGTGTGLTVTASTVTDAGTSKGKIAITANLSVSQEICALFTAGVSLRITGSAAKGYLYYE